MLAQTRKELGLTQEQLATELGYSRSVVANCERGRGISELYLRRFAQKYPQVAERMDGIRQASGDKDALGSSSARENEFDDMLFRRSQVTSQLDGTWYALWESTAENEEVINSEELIIKMKKNGTVQLWNVEKSPENPKGGYVWLGEGRLFDNQYILTTYIAREPNVRSKGCLYLVIHRSGQFINGQWIGCNYDSDWARGLVVIARERERLPELLANHRRQLPKLPYNKNVD